jgi:hypothetical protein
MTIVHTYRHRFFSLCPNNGQIIEYRLELKTRAPSRVMVEHIVTACQLHKRAFHEDIIADLSARFSNATSIILEAHHHGVDIESVSE